MCLTTHVVDSACPFSGVLSGYNTEILTIYPIVEIMHVKDLFLDFEKEEVHIIEPPKKTKFFIPTVLSMSFS